MTEDTPARQELAQQNEVPIAGLDYYEVYAP